MSDVFSPEKRSAVMRRVKGRDTAPEMTVRKLLTGLGLRYRLHRKELPGAPDIVMAGRRIALFVHGCFWHGHDCARGARVPKQNRGYWTAKIGRNRARDERTRGELEALGWTPVVVWECELKDQGALAARLQSLLIAPRNPWPEPGKGHRQQRNNTSGEEPRE
jgi:DNA mismatch endonuclease (patch repair protein)